MADPPGFRAWLAPMVKRRVRAEPDVGTHVPVKAPTFHKPSLQFDAEHFDHYRKVAEAFASYYRHVKRESDLQGKQLNLVALLRRIQEVGFALSNPKLQREGPSRYNGGLTSKQRWIIDRMAEVVGWVKRVLVFVQSPALAKLIETEARARGQRVIALHGGIPPKARMRLLDEQFREGDLDGLVLTYKANATGLNLPMANWVILGDRDWTARVEDQAIARVLRPEQTAQVGVDIPQIEGSLDVCQDQLVTGKREANAAGLDYGEQDTERPFLHLDHVFGLFAKEWEARHGITTHQQREMAHVA